MATVRLTNAMRDSLIEKVMKDAYIKEKEALKVEKHQLAIDAYSVMVSEKHQEVLAQLPNDFCYSGDNFQINVIINDHGGERGLRFTLPKEMPLPISVRYGYFHLGKRNDKLVKKYDAFQKSNEAYEKLRADLKNEMWKVLYAATTVQRLIEMWPEAENIIPQEWVEPKAGASTLPMVVIDNLNAMLGKAIAQPELKKAA